MKLRSFLLILVAAMAVAKGASAAKNTLTNVTIIVHDTDAAGAQVLLRSDDYNGSGKATYSPSSISTNINYDGRYFLRLYSQSLRPLYITPNDLIDGSQPMAPPPGYYWQYVELVFGCYDQNLNIVPFQNILTSSRNCKMILDFGYNGTEYALVMGPTASLPAPGPATVAARALNMRGATVPGQRKWDSLRKLFLARMTGNDEPSFRAERS